MSFVRSGGQVVLTKETSHINYPVLVIIYGMVCMCSGLGSFIPGTTI